MFMNNVNKSLICNICTLVVQIILSFVIKALNSRITKLRILNRKMVIHASHSPALCERMFCPHIWCDVAAWWCNSANAS